MRSCVKMSDKKKQKQLKETSTGSGCIFLSLMAFETGELNTDSNYILCGDNKLSQGVLNLERLSHPMSA